MQICLKNTISFKGNIIDSHAHLGEWYEGKNYQPKSLNSLAKDTFEVTIDGKKQTDEIDCFLVSNLSCMYEKEQGKFVKDEVTGNKELLEISKSNPKIKVELVCEPRNGNAQNIQVLLQEHDKEVVALKFHPQCSKLDANDIKYEPYMQLAKQYKKPCVFHSDRIDTNASPEKIYELAKKTPDVPVVLYHMSMASGGAVKDLPSEQIKAKNLEMVANTTYTGSEDYKNYVFEYREKWNQDGIDVVKKSIKNKDANLFLEVSWTKPETIVKAIKEVGEDKVLFGTDSPFDEKKEKYIQYVSDIKTAIKKEFGDKSDNIINKVFFENSNKLFFGGKLKMSVGQVKEVTSSITSDKKTQEPPKAKGKLLPIALGVIAILGLGALVFSSKKKNKYGDKFVKN